MRNVEKIKRILLVVLIISAILELCIFPSVANLTGVFFSIISTLLYFNYILRPHFYKENPLLFLVSIILFGFMYLPLPATLVDGNAISHDMYNPELTFIFQFVYFVLFIVALRITARISRYHRGLNRLLNNVGFYTIPSFSQTFMLAAFGWIFQFQKLFNQFSGEDLYVANMGTYTLFSIFIYSPIVNLFRDLLGGVSCSKKQKILIWIYIIILGISMTATNSRGAMLSSFFIISLCFMLRRILAKDELRIITVKNTFIAILAFFIISGPLDDMAFAMLMARNQRSGMNYKELFSLTLEYYNDKDRLNKYRNYLDKRAGELSDYDWNEKYVSNVFLQRFCNYRVVDASIHHALKAGIPNGKMMEDFGNRLIAMFPQPIVDVISPGFNKSNYTYSPMDLLYSISSKKALHRSYIVGGDVGTGLATVGFFYFPLIFAVYVLELLIISNLVYHHRGKKQFSIITLIGLMGLFTHYQVGSGMIVHVTFILWSFWWTTLWGFLSLKILTMVKPSYKFWVSTQKGAKN